MARQPIEHRHAEGFLEPGFPGLDGIEQMVQRARYESIA
jgi:hypothetical protein